MQKGDTVLIRQLNLGLVYQTLDSSGPLSRSALVQYSGLSGASITKIIRELIDAQLVVECGEQLALRGRHPTLLKLDGRQHAYVAMRLGRGYVAMGLFNLTGECIVRERCDLKGRGQKQLTEQIQHHLAGFIERCRHRLCAIAISLPAQVDSEMGDIRYFPYYDETNWPLGSILRENFQIPVYLADDIRSWILAEFFWGSARKSHNALLFVLHNDIGMGVIIDGNLLSSPHSRIGSLNHLPMEMDETPCYCGLKGCARTRLTTPALEQRYQSLAGISDPVSIQVICDRALTGEAVALELLRVLVQELQHLLIPLLLFLNPDTLMLSGELARLQSILFPLLRKEFAERLPSAYAERIHIEAARFYEEPTRPTAALIQQVLYQGELLEQIINPRH